MSKNTILVLLIVFSNIIFITYPLYNDNKNLKEEIRHIKELKEEQIYNYDIASSKYIHMEKIKELSEKAGFVKISEKIEVEDLISLELKFKCDFYSFQEFIKISDIYGKKFLIEEGYFNFDNNGRDSYIIIKHLGGSI